MFSSDFCKCCSMVPWQYSLVAWGGPLLLVGILLNSDGAFACPAVQKSAPVFGIVFPVHKVFFINSALRDKLPCGRALWSFRHFLSVWAGGLQIPFLGVCANSRLRDSPLPLVSLLTCYMPLFLLMSHLALELLWLYWGKGFGKSVLSSAIKGIISLL